MKKKKENKQTNKNTNWWLLSKTVS